jgi:hypothetical protein
MFFATALSTQLTVQMTSPVCISRRDENKSAKAPKQNMHTIMLMRLNTMFDDIVASSVPKSLAIYDVAGMNIVFAAMTMTAAATIIVQLK